LRVARDPWGVKAFVRFVSRAQPVAAAAAAASESKRAALLQVDGFANLKLKLQQTGQLTGQWREILIKSTG